MSGPQRRAPAAPPRSPRPVHHINENSNKLLTFVAITAFLLFITDVSSQRRQQQQPSRPSRPSRPQHHGSKLRSGSIRPPQSSRVRPTPPPPRPPPPSKRIPAATRTTTITAGTQLPHLRCKVGHNIWSLSRIIYVWPFAPLLWATNLFLVLPLQ